MTKAKPPIPEGASLKAMAEDKTITTVSKSVPVIDIDPRVIHVRPGFNMRPVDPDHVAMIKAAMLGGATFPPLDIVIEDRKPCLLDGEHRLTACLELIAEGVDIKRVKALEFKGNMAQQILFMMGRAKGKTALPLQVGTQYALLMNTYGMSYAEIAKSDGVSVQHVKDMIRLTQQEPEITNLIKAGTVTATTALKLVKQVGSKEAAKTLEKAATVASAAGKKVTQKTINEVAAPKGITPAVKAAAGKSVVTAAANRRDVVKEHLSEMLESPSITGANREHVKATLALCMGLQPTAPAPQESVNTFLARYANHDNQVVTYAAGIMAIVASGKMDKLPAAGSVEAEHYGHRRWLENLATDSGQRKPVRTAVHWFLAVMDAHRSNREVAPPPSVMNLTEAIEAEIDSFGAVTAEEMCPEAAHLIKHLRGV